MIRCINLRLTIKGGLYAWEFQKNGHEAKARVQGQLVFNSSAPLLRTALAGFGVACIPEDMAQEHILEGRLNRVLEDWCTLNKGYHIYYASRRQSSNAFSLLINALRYQG